MPVLEYAIVIGHHYELFYAIYLSTRDLFPSPFTPIALTNSYLLYLALRGYSSISADLNINPWPWRTLTITMLCGYYTVYTHRVQGARCALQPT
jgi:hypothetical protein